MFVATQQLRTRHIREVIRALNEKTAEKILKQDDGLQILNFPYFAGNLTLMNGGHTICNGGLPAKLCDGVADGTVVDVEEVNYPAAPGTIIRRCR